MRDGPRPQMLISAVVDGEHGRRKVKFGVVEQPRPKETFDVDFDRRVQLIGASFPEKAKRGDTIDVTLQLLVERDCSGTSPKILIQASAPGGNANAAQADHTPLAGKVPAAEWVPGDLLLDTSKLTVPMDVHADELIVCASVYDGKERWSTYPKQRDDRVELGRIRLDGASSPDAGMVTARQPSP